MNLATEVSSGRSFFEEKLVELRDSVLSNGIEYNGQKINDLTELDFFLSENLNAFKGSVYEELKRDVLNVENELSISMPDKGVTFFTENATLEGKLEMLNWYCNPKISIQKQITVVECVNMPYNEVPLNITFKWNYQKVEEILISFNDEEKATKYLTYIKSNEKLLHDSWLTRQIGIKRHFNWGIITTCEKGIKFKIKRT
ncbi:hypothetical protein BUL40_13545 [Croceivirga radicis]|uniref:Uncharacterized protein n=2 Tax=Croceivirga radicis TaxID=1929488 RepID=A0A1V6LNV0_9FLAO|nr:hypothetical protein BUL40_13545 [Croceivirga radicis]